MTAVLVALLAILWAIVLVPPLLRTRENTSLTVSVGSFNRGLQALGSSHYTPGGRYVLTPRTPLDAPDPRLVIFRRRRIFFGLVSGLFVTLVLGVIPALRPIWWISLGLALWVGGFVVFLISEKGKKTRYLRLSGSPRSTPVRSAPDMPRALLSYEEDAVRIMDRRQPASHLFGEDASPPVATPGRSMFQLFDEEDSAPMTSPGRSMFQLFDEDGSVQVTGPDRLAFRSFDENQVDDGLSELGWARAGNR